MRRDDSGLYAWALLMILLFALWAGVSSSPTTRNEADPTRQETQQEEQDTSEAMDKEEAELPQKDTLAPDAEPNTEPENQQELSPEEIWQQETDYLLGYILGTTIYDSYEAMETDYEYNIVPMSRYTYQEYCEATEELLKEAITDSEISDKSLKRYNKVLSNIPDREYLKITQDNISSIDGFQEGVTYRSYMEVIKELYHSKDITDEQYAEYQERMSFYENEETGEQEDVTHETVMGKIEYAKKILAKNGKEDIPVPYFI